MINFSQLKRNEVVFILAGVFTLFGIFAYANGISEPFYIWLGAKITYGFALIILLLNK